MDISLMQSCKCGCGKPVKQYSDGRKREYAKGHKVGIVYSGTRDMLPTECAYCHESILVERWRIEKFGACFCSRSHANRYRSLRALSELTCEYCGKKFQMKASRKQGNHIFCSLSCAARFSLPTKPSRVSVKCDQCGASMEVHTSKYKLNKHFFCSLGCRKVFIQGTNNPAYRSGMGRKREYAANWKSQRRAAILRDGGRCQVCNRIPKKSCYLHVHHIQPAYTFDGDWERANDLRNLICLCYTCHKKVELGKVAIQPRLI